MKTLLITTMLLMSGFAMGEEKPRLGQFDPTQCGCETCFTRNGICTAVDQSQKRNVPKQDQRGPQSQSGGRGRKIKVDRNI